MASDYIRVSAELHRAVKIEAAQRGVGMGELVAAAFGAYAGSPVLQGEALKSSHVKIASSDSQVASVFDRVTLQDRKLEEIADVLGRVTAALADLGAKIEQHQRPARPALTKTKRAKAG